MEPISKNRIPKVVSIPTIAVILLVLGYTIWTDTSYYLYLIWNLFLAFLVFFTSSSLLKYQSSPHRRPLVFVAGFMIWILLFPNAPYLVTDLIHLGANPIIPFWYDALILLLVAWIGIVISIFSLLKIEQIFQSRFDKFKTNLFISIIILLASLGIYLGRFPRWNSWDMIHCPMNIIEDLLNIFQHPLNYPEALITVVFFFFFLTLAYQTWKYCQKQLLSRAGI